MDLNLQQKRVIAMLHFSSKLIQNFTPPPPPPPPSLSVPSSLSLHPIPRSLCLSSSPPPSYAFLPHPPSLSLKVHAYKQITRSLTRITIRSLSGWTNLRKYPELGRQPGKSLNTLSLDHLSRATGSTGPPHRPISC